ncbi:MAG: MotA/TolQ/ExbB proton channel family protein [Anaerovibrio sp.]|uniref:MotA/TolQ/ExbB proton channel family protein n=1 Tax=Anaerovibrio sp. TaxID=1872532 RepID=UPI0025D8D079|nr:MotA/TolQ/ExbB proton channel family protein [Anaerovibrio sp.]MCR5176667.1 MotA/TolQ/ExbB proton channel family protein [Anaerovibrio sp.]
MEFLGTIIHWFMRGGMVMYFLLAASILSVAIIIERLKYYSSKAINIEKYCSELTEKLENDSLDELLDNYKDKSRAADIMVTAGIRAAKGKRNVEAAMESAAQLEAAKLKKGLPVLSMLVTLAPILGLMGTVIGMIQSFSVFNIQQGAPMAITGGVGEALIATASGLAVAVIALLGHSFFSYSLDNILTKLEQISSLVMEYVPVKQ